MIKYWSSFLLNYESGQDEKVFMSDFEVLIRDAYTRMSVLAPYAVPEFGEQCEQSSLNTVWTTLHFGLREQFLGYHSDLYVQFKGIQIQFGSANKTSNIN